MLTAVGLAIHVAAVLMLAAADPTPAVDATARPSCLDVLARAFAEQGRENRPAMLRRLGGQLGMSSEQMEQLLAGAHGGVERCFNLLTERAR